MRSPIINVVKILFFVALVLGVSPSRSDWIALAKGGFAVPSGRTAVEMLTEMNVLLASDDPVLRDDVAFSAGERWILRDHRLSPRTFERC
jgi:hypothetical protein